MTEFQILLLPIAFKSSLILGIIAALTFLAGRRWPRVCSVWKRVAIVALLALPVTVGIVPTIDIPVLSRPTGAIANLDRIVAARGFPHSASVPRDESAISQVFPDFQWDATNAAPEVRPITAPIVFAPRPRPKGHSLIASLALVYGFVVIVLLTKLVRAWWGLERLKQTSSPVADAEWQIRLTQWAEVLCIRRPVELRVSDEVSVPMTFGWRSPVILVPRGCLLSCDRIRRDAILIHELTHIANGDFLWQILTHLMASLYWLHPLVWLVRREAEVLRERLCDNRCSRYLGRGTGERGHSTLRF